MEPRHTQGQDPDTALLATFSEAQLRGRRSAKWALTPPDAIPLWVAEADVPLAAPVRDALQAALDGHDTGYAAGVRDYLDAFTGFATHRWGWTPPSRRHTQLVADVMTGLAEALRLVTDPGDPVLIDDPVYPPFATAVRHAGREVVHVPLGPQGRLDLAAIDAAAGAATAGGGTAAYLLCNPHNPSGAVATADELADLAAVARRRGVRVISDEIHAPLVHTGPRFVPYLAVPGTEDAYVVTSASKGWSLAGAKAGLLLGGAATGEELHRLPDLVGHGASHLGVVAHTAAFAAGGPWLDRFVAELAETTAWFASALPEHLPGVRHRPPVGTYLAWLDVRDTTLGDDPTARLAGAGLVVTDGAAFGPAGTGHVRLNLATSRARLRTVLARLREAAAA